MTRPRETFASWSGVVLAMAGMAIGLGNIWRFPYMMGAYGGGWFLLTYLGFVTVLGIPALMSEWALGRSNRLGPIGAFEKAGAPAGRYWGYLFSLAIFMAASYYVVVIGWLARYALVFAVAEFAQPPEIEFRAFAGSLPAQAAPVWGCLLMCLTALHFGVRRGIERISKVVTPAFFVILLALAARVLTLDGAWEKTAAYFAGGGQFSARTVLAALGQSIFSLALGGTTMVTYGSYLHAGQRLSRVAIATAGLDTAGSLLATLVIVPPALVFAVDLKSGPALLFEVVPSLFQSMPAGSLLAAVFLLSVWLVAMLSLMAAYEVIAAGVRDAWEWSRTRALLFLLVTQTVLTIPAMMSIDYIVFSDLFWGSTMQPVGAAAAVIALAWFGGRARTLEQTSAPRLYLWIKYAVPAGILTGLLYGWFG